MARQGLLTKIRDTMATIAHDDPPPMRLPSPPLPGSRSVRSISAPLRSVVLGVGSYLPERVLTNEELATLVDTSDEWIVQRTGIKQRHIAAPGETTSMLGERAARAALAAAGLAPEDIDLIIVGTSTPDYTFPSTATQIQAALGIHRGRRFRSAGRVLGIRLRAGDGRQVPALGLAQARAGDRRRDLLAHDRLDRPHDLRAVRRRRRRHGAGSARQRRLDGRTRRPRRRICARTVAIAPSSMSTAALLRRRRSAICAWRARTCSASPSDR